MRIPSVTALFASLFVLLGIAPGAQAPDFSAQNQDGKVIKLSASKGKPVLLYFYPKDDTPGCTKEACSFRDEYKKFTDLGVVVYGISRQDAKSHTEFRNKHKLPFDLLVDADGSIAKAYGVETMAVVGFHKRESILIAPSGLVTKHYTKVDPDKHVAEAYKDVKELVGAEKK